MYRVELKALLLVLVLVLLFVPNVPCGVESIETVYNSSNLPPVPNVPCGVESPPVPNMHHSKLSCS